MKKATMLYMPPWFEVYLLDMKYFNKVPFKLNKEEISTVKYFKILSYFQYWYKLDGVATISL